VTTHWAMTFWSEFWSHESIAARHVSALVGVWVRIAISVVLRRSRFAFFLQGELWRKRLKGFRPFVLLWTC
jgi:hypothetical protein